jgi:hypothetical protein
MNDELKNKTILPLSALLSINSKLSKNILKKAPHITKGYFIDSYESIEDSDGFYELKMTMKFSVPSYLNLTVKGDNKEDVDLIIKPNKSELMIELMRDKESIPLSFAEIIAIKIYHSLYLKKLIKE